MAVHFTIYADERTAAALQHFMAGHRCTVTDAVATAARLATS